MTADAVRYESTAIACPTTGEPCPARTSIVDKYTTDPTVLGRLSSQIDLEDANHPRFDNVKMQGLLREHSLQALARGCVGPEAEVCPVREAMNESKIRRGAVVAIRSALGKLRNSRD